MQCETDWVLDDLGVFQSKIKQKPACGSLPLFLQISCVETDGILVIIIEYIHIHNYIINKNSVALYFIFIIES